MSARKEHRIGKYRFEKKYIYALATLSAVLGAILAIHRLVIDIQLLGVFLPLVVIFAIGGPIIMGYNGNTFLAGVLTGVLPCAGAYASILAWEPFTTQRIGNMGAAVLRATGLVLPAISILFIIGVGLRRDGTLTNQKRQLAFRLAAAVVFSIAIMLLFEIGILRASGDQ